MHSMKSIDFQFLVSLCGPSLPFARHYWCWNLYWLSGFLFIFILIQILKLISIWRLIIFSSKIYWLSQLADDSNLTEILILSMALSWGFTLIFVICEPGEYVTKHFFAFGEEFEQCDWYMLPIKLRRLYLIFLLDTQQSIHIECYGRILCTRDTLKKVIKFLLWCRINSICPYRPVRAIWNLKFLRKYYSWGVRVMLNFK